MSDPPALLTASPEALTALFSADPLTLSDSDLMALVTEFRRRRVEFVAQDKDKGRVARGPRPKVDTADALKLDLQPGEVDLDDLFGEGA